ncbi:hypothetical protein AB1Y20_011967 [Prymnesium parvum]|uniref:Palmitoyltransferase n=1 Tax=Prymnesium parvum TaxID=97485 RepID=A0AB34IN24_PRYPA
MAAYVPSVLDAAATAASVLGLCQAHLHHRHALERNQEMHQQALSHDSEVHGRGIAAETEAHFQQLIAELLTAAMEADRDVWEQRNGQFNNLMLSATLMFGIAMSAIIEGNFQYTGHDEETRNPIVASLFATFEAFALSSLFLCLVCCLLVSRRMSLYMINRAARFVDRLGQIITTANLLINQAALIDPLPADSAATARKGTESRAPQPPPPAARRPSAAAAAPGGSGPRASFEPLRWQNSFRCDKQSGERSLRSQLQAIRRARDAFQKDMMCGLEATSGGKRAIQLQENLGIPRLHSSRTAPSLLGGRQQSEPLLLGDALLSDDESEPWNTKTFDEFWNHHCAWIGGTAYASFVGGTASVWGAVMVFLVAEFQLVWPAPAIFGVLCGGSLIASLALTYCTLRDDDRVVRQSLPPLDPQVQILNLARQITTPPLTPSPRPTE